VIGAVAGALGSVLGDVIGSALIVGAIALQTGVLGALMLVQIGLLGAILAVNTFDALTPFAKGGEVKGYASGGNVGSLPRPSNIPASDTVPAWLTPGEFVIKRASVKKYGLGLLSAMNNGLLSPSSLQPAALATGGHVQKIKGYAQGGSVRNVRTPNTQQQAPQKIILPVFPTTNENMEKMVSGGKQAFTKGVNAIEYVGDPNKARKW